MNAGLRYLLVRTAIGKWRQIRRRANGPKGLFVGAGVLALLALMLVPQILVRMQRDPEEIRALAEPIRTWVPSILLLGMLIFGFSKAALFFKPAEIQFLFPAPIPRRELLIYNILARLRVQVLSAAWCSIFLLQGSTSWVGAFLALLFGFASLQVTAQTEGLFFAAIGERVTARVRWALAILVLGGGTILFLATRASLGPEATLIDIAGEVLRHPVVATLAWITRPFVEIYLAESAAQIALWVLVSLGILALEIGILLKLDLAYSEGVIAQGRKFQQAMRRVSSGGGAFAMYGPRKTRLRIPPLPRLGGAGPIAWRQFQEMARNQRGVLMIGLTMFAWIAMMLVIPATIDERFPTVDPTDGGTYGGRVIERPGMFEGSATSAVVMSLVMTSMLTMNFPFDFRRDLDRMTLLKALPLRSTAIAAGQILPMCVLLLFWQCIGLGFIAIVTQDVSARLAISVLALLPIVNWIVAATDNITFLLLPYRMAVKDPGNVPFMGRLMLVMLAKVLIVAALLGAAAAAGWLATLFIAKSMTLAVVVAGIVLAIACVPLTFLVASSFESFDVAKDIPA